eukprot:s6301_g1.t1
MVPASPRASSAAGPSSPSSSAVVVLDVAREATDEGFNLAAKELRQAWPGRSGNPEVPTLIYSRDECKVWLGGLPNDRDLRWPRAKKISLVCSAMGNTAKEEGGLADLFQMACPVAHMGEAGVHRAPILCALVVAHVFRRDFDETYGQIKQLRAIDEDGVRNRRNGRSSSGSCRGTFGEDGGSLWHVMSCKTVGDDGRYQPSALLHVLQRITLSWWNLRGSAVVLSGCVSAGSF